MASNTVIQTNTLALNSHRNLTQVGTLQSKASQRLSSGYKVNSAADDAAGLAISEKMRSQIRGLDMASKNTQDAISLIQTAEGGMQEIDNMLQRIRELVVQASNDTNEYKNDPTDYGDRQKIQDEINQLVTEIDSMSDRVEFNKKKVIDGTYSITTTVTDTTDSTYTDALQAAKDAVVAAQEEVDDLGNAVSYDDAFAAFDSLVGDIITMIGDINAAITAAGGSVQIDPTDVIDKADYGDLIDPTKTLAERQQALADFISGIALTEISDVLADIDGNGTKLDEDDHILDNVTALSDALTRAGNVLNEALEGGTALAHAELNLETAKSSLTTIQAEYDANKTSDSSESGTGLYFQVGANSNQGWVLSIGTIKTDILGIGDGKGVSTIDILKDTGEGHITGLLDTLDTALTYVTAERSKLGAAQNRLEYTDKSLQISSENLSAAESRIRDTDMAKEMMNLTKANVLQQASISMLAQANQAPQSVLQLLQ